MPDSSAASIAICRTCRTISVCVCVCVCVCVYVCAGLVIYCLVPTTLGVGVALVRAAKGNEGVALLLTVGSNMLGVVSASLYGSAECCQCSCLLFAPDELTVHTACECMCMCFNRPYRAYRQGTRPCRAHKSGQGKAGVPRQAGPISTNACVCVCVQGTMPGMLMLLFAGYDTSSLSVKVNNCTHRSCTWQHCITAERRSTPGHIEGHKGTPWTNHHRA